MMIDEYHISTKREVWFSQEEEVSTLKKKKWLG